MNQPEPQSECERIRGLLLEGRGLPSTKAATAAHLGTCPSCRAEAAWDGWFASQLWRDHPTPSTDLQPKVTRRQEIGWLMGMATAVVGAATLVLMGFLGWYFWPDRELRENSEIPPATYARHAADPLADLFDAAAGTPVQEFSRIDQQQDAIVQVLDQLQEESKP